MRTWRCFDFHDAVFDEFGEGAAHGLKLQAQVAANLFARHAQHQLGLRKAARVQALRQVQQKRRQSLLGSHAAQQQHHAVFAHDFAAHDLVHMVLQRASTSRDSSSMRSKGMTQTSASSSATASQVWWSLTMPSKPDDFAGHLEAGDLVAAVF